MVVMPLLTDTVKGTKSTTPMWTLTLASLWVIFQSLLVMGTVATHHTHFKDFIA